MPFLSIIIFYSLLVTLVEAYDLGQSVSELHENILTIDEAINKGIGYFSKKLSIS